MLLPFSKTGGANSRKLSVEGKIKQVFIFILEIDQNWKGESAKFRQEMSNVLKGTDPILKIAKLMSMKDYL